jgi:wyosine [tRNA(Phe)-imidazoG37] synthetase (radical SAM superfamily)
MATFLFDEIIFGPVNSRRLGISLGINLLPTNCKVCNFDCVYCECGWTKEFNKKDLPTREVVYNALKNRLIEANENNEKLDVITFAGNGEPTMHKEFPEIIDDTIQLKNQYYKSLKIAVLSNATLVNNAKIFNALHKTDYNILKLDSAKEETIKLINQPLGNYNLPKLVDNLKENNANLIIQTLFLKGKVNSAYFNNSSDEEVIAWLELIREIKPKQVMLYSIARDTPSNTLEKIPNEMLMDIAKKVNNMGIETSVS